ncbi:MAG: hypothetical protein M0Z48_01250 [Nitrospiraceae bacterium]|nr:hypothetical protein [Nitrospiraceae bacterium]
MKRDEGNKSNPGTGKEVQPETDGQCRCKEVSKKTPLELLKLMLQDFTFRKKKRGDK